MEIVQIVPRLAPAVDGVGDHAANLARQLFRDFGIETHFVVGDPAWKGASKLETFAVTQVSERSTDALSKCLDEKSNVILLHYVGYGYEKRGCPHWLVEALERWQHEDKCRRLVTMFHEVYASGPLWSSSFWLSTTQKKLAARLARISSHIVTNREGYAEILRHFLKRDQQISVSPVFSNVGEPGSAPLRLSLRRRRLAVFGNCGNRERVFRKSVRSLSEICRAFEIEEIVDIGSRVNHGVSRIDGVPVTSTGIQPAEAVSALLSDSVVGFFSHSPDYLGKSGVFAAYSSHRTLPIGASSNGQAADGLVGGEHFWSANSRNGNWDLEAGQKVADNAYRWYQEHNLFRQSQMFASLIRKD